MTPIRDEFDRWLEEESAGLRQHWDSPELWPRIAGSLEVEKRGMPQSSGFRWSWMAAAAAAFILLLAPAGWLVWKARPVNPALMTESALREARQAEQSYAKSIERLSILAAPKLHNPPSPLIASYRERLLLLDDAIAALKVEADRNPYNDHLQRELLAIYREKQKTLEGILDDSKTPVAP